MSWVCPKCEQSFVSKTSLDRHFRKKKSCDELKHACEKCKRLFVTAKKLKAHVAICTGGSRRRLTLDDAHAIAVLKKGTCVSTRFTRSIDPLEWQCENPKHVVFLSSLNQVKDGGHWCPECAGNMHHTYDNVRKFIELKGGTLLSDHYVNSHVPLHIGCEKGHEWWARFSSLTSNDSWCPRCAADTKSERMRTPFEEIVDFISNRGGTILSEEQDYRNARSKLWIRCTEGHRWETSMDRVRNSGYWCPNCLYKNENECRRILEELLNSRFDKAYPEWLKGQSIREIDGCNEFLGLGFEYNGEQHYRYIPFFHHNGPEDLFTIQARDKLRYEECAKNGVALIIIPYDVTNKRSFIIRELEFLGYI